MKVLVVNAGSSSLKYQLIDMSNEKVIAKGNCECINMKGGKIVHKYGDDQQLEEVCHFPSHTEAFEKLVEVLTTGEGAVIKDMSEIGAVGHRIVQGAEVFPKAVIVTDEVIQKIDDLQELAPVHNHPHALALWACKKVMPAEVPQVVVFDTAFHQTIPQKAFMYGMPYEIYEKYHVRKYGFHGTSHRFVSMKLAELLGGSLEGKSVVSCHLGNGSSITAIKDGKSVDTSMGFTPLDGIIMGTRSGAVDPSAVTYVQKKLGLTPDQMSDFLNKKSGFLGLSDGLSSDNREITAAIAKGDEKCILVSEILTYGIKKYIGSYAAAMNGLDAIIFTGGIGENAPEVRQAVCENMEVFGIKIDPEANLIRGELRKISTEDSKVEVWVIPTNEELLIARDTLAVAGLDKNA